MTQPLPSPLPNGAFSLQNPYLQIAWDSTSLGELKTCDYKYYLTLVLGYVPRHRAVDLTFGLHYHSALERYDHARSAGKDHEASTRIAVKHALEVTWDKAKQQPWRSDDANKNRLTLVRTVVWYLDQFAQDPLETVQLANGKPAVELSFRMETGYKAMTGETFMLSGHLDRLAKTEDGQTWIVDRKTSRHQLDDRFFAKFTPDNQMSTYALGGRVTLNTTISGLIIDGAQIAVTFSRFERRRIGRTPAQTDEWFEDLGIWLARAQINAATGKWPQNDKSCHHYRGCQFLNVCSKPKAVHRQWLDAGFERRVWNPLEVRGDI